MVRLGKFPFLLLAFGLAACQGSGSPPPGGSPAEVRARQEQMEHRYDAEREVLEIERRQRMINQGRGP